MEKNQFIRKVYRLVGQAIAATRRSNGDGFTQQQLAKEAGGGLSRSSIANIESGRQRIGIHQLYLIARALRLKPTDLLPSTEDVYRVSESDLENFLPKRRQERAWVKEIVRKGKEEAHVKTGSDRETRKEASGRSRHKISARSG